MNCDNHANSIRGDHDIQTFFFKYKVGPYQPGIGRVDACVAVSVFPSRVSLNSLLSGMWRCISGLECCGFAADENLLAATGNSTHCPSANGFVNPRAVAISPGQVGILYPGVDGAQYLSWMALLIMLGQRLRQELGLPVLATVLAAFLLFGSELAAFTGIVQQYDLSNYVFDRVVALKETAAVAGNVAQPNHFADYVTLGLISLGLLHMRWRMRSWHVILLALPLLFVLVLSGSRSIWLFLIALSAMAYLWQRRDKSCLPLLRYSLLLILGFGLMHLIVQIPGLTGTSATVTSGGRLIKEIGGFVEIIRSGTGTESRLGGVANGRFGFGFIWLFLIALVAMAYLWQRRKQIPCPVVEIQSGIDSRVWLDAGDSQNPWVNRAFRRRDACRAA